MKAKEHISINQIKNVTAEEILLLSAQKFNNEMVVSIGFGNSGIVLLDLIKKLNLNVQVFYIDTDMLFQETYDLKTELEDHFKIKFICIKTNLTLDEQEKKHGEKLWKRNPDQCCYLRKIKPLNSFLKNKKAWISGIRKEQTMLRSGFDRVIWDKKKYLYRIHPLLAWTDQEIGNYIEKHRLPYNKLFDEGYTSIGCQCCTVKHNKKSRQLRDGRWPEFTKQECGIHQIDKGNENDVYSTTE